MPKTDVEFFADTRAREEFPQSSFWDNVQTSLGETLDEHSPVLSRVLNQVNTEDRDKQVKQFIESGAIPKGEVNAATFRIGRIKSVDYNRLASWYNKNNVDKEPIKTDSDLLEERNKVLEQRRAYREKVFGGWTGNVGDFNPGEILGAMWGYAIDPLNAFVEIATAGVSGLIGSAQGVSRGLYALKTSSRYAAENGIVNIAEQPFIMSWQDETNGDYTFDDAVRNILFDIGAGATVGGVVGTLTHSIKVGDIHSGNEDQLVKRLQSDYGLSEHESASLVTSISELNEANKIDPDMTVKDFYDKTKQIEDSLNINHSLELGDIELGSAKEDSWFEQRIKDIPDDFAIQTPDGAWTKAIDYVDQFKSEFDYWASKLDCLKKL